MTVRLWFRRPENRINYFPMMKSFIQLGKYRLGPGYPPFIVAELSGNHNQSLDRALELVRAAAKAKVQGVKIQTYTADTMTLDLNEKEFLINDQESLWKGKTLYKLYQEAHTPWDWHKPIFDLCRELGLVGFSTPFDASAVDFLVKLEVPCFKIASFENIDIPLIRKVAAAGKPLIISTGMAEIAELDEAIRTARQVGIEDIILLKCTSTYPASPENSNIMTIPHMRELFKVQVGLSDHSLGIGVAVAGVALGATMIEKHFTLDRSESGVDAAFSMEPAEMKALVEETTRAWQALGKICYGFTAGEHQAAKFRRSLYIVEDMKEGEVFTPRNLRAIRPGLGLAPKYYDIFIGKKVSRDVRHGTPLSWDMLC